MQTCEQAQEEFEGLADRGVSTVVEQGHLRWVTANMEGAGEGARTVVSRLLGVEEEEPHLAQDKPCGSSDL